MRSRGGGTCGGFNPAINRWRVKKKRAEGCRDGLLLRYGRRLPWKPTGITGGWGCWERGRSDTCKVRAKKGGSGVLCVGLSAGEGR